LPGLVFVAGFDHLAYGLGLLAGVVLSGILIAPHLAAAHDATPSGAIGERFGRPAASLAAILVVLVAIPLLVAELSLIGLVAESSGLPYLPMLAIAAALALVIAAAGEAVLSAVSALSWVLLATSLLAPLALIAAKSQGLSFPLFSFGGVLREITGLEERLVEGGLVDFDTFSAHLTPFARLTGLDIFALVLTLALGTAALPHLAATMVRARGAGRAASARLAGAWTAFFVMIVLTAVPALAAVAKLEIYRQMTAAIPLASLPQWLEAPLKSDFASIHGTSLRLFESVAEAERTGRSEPEAIGAALAAKSAPLAERWQALDPGAQAALAAAAKPLAASAPAQDSWKAYRLMLPAVAAGAGNAGATLTQSALAIEPMGLFLAIPGLAGYPRELALLMSAAAILTALAVAARLAGSIARLVAPSPASGTPSVLERLVGSALAFAVVAAAACFAARRPVDLVSIAVTALAIAGSGLFPALAVGLGWRRATQAGVVAAMLIGTGVTLYYVAGTQLYPAAFYTTWPSLSNAGDSAIEEWTARETELDDADGDEAKTAAAAARDDLARGNRDRPGLANWAGIDSASAAIFGAPAGLLALVLASLLTRRRRSA
jgi:cation/acetate symporter